MTGIDLAVDRSITNEIGMMFKEQDVQQSPLETTVVPETCLYKLT